MTKDKLIVNQSLRLAKQEKKLNKALNILRNTNAMFVSIGAPMNDNILKFNKEQLSWIYRVNQNIEETLNILMEKGKSE